MSSPVSRHTETPPERGYETRDVNPKVILWLVAAVVLVVGGAMGGLWALQQNHHSVATRNQPPRLMTVDQTAPAPRLQAAPVRDYQEYLNEQERELSTYGWVNRDRGIVRIPIERAMDVALERGLRKSADRDEQQAPEPSSIDRSEKADP
jgi:hypothetical protein